MAIEHDLQPLLDVQQNQLGLVFSDGDAIDTKALALLGANIAILLFIAQASLHLSILQSLLLFAPLVISVILDGFAAWPQKYSAGVSLDLNPEYLSLEAEALLLQLLADTQSYIETNTKINKIRWRYCLGSTILSALSLLVLFVIL